MLANKIKEIKNGRVIAKDSKTKDAVRPGLVEVGKTLFWHGREGDVVSVNGDKIVLDIDGEKYTVKASECSQGTTGDSKDAMPLIKRHLLRTDGGPGSGIKGHTTAEEPTQEKPAGKKEAPAVASSHQAVREKYGWSTSSKESPKELELRDKEKTAKQAWLNEEDADHTDRAASLQKFREYNAVIAERKKMRLYRLYESSSDKTPVPEDHAYAKLGKTNASVAAKLANVVLSNNDDLVQEGGNEKNRWGENQVYEAADYLGLPTRGPAMGLVGRKIITEAKRLVKAEQG